MSVLFRCRVDSKVLKRADSITAALGTDTPEAVRMFLAELVRTKRLPLTLSLTAGEPVLDQERRNLILRTLDDSEGW